MTGRARCAGFAATALLAMAGALPAVAGAQVRAPAFTDYGRSTADQYGSPGGGGGGVAGGAESQTATGTTTTTAGAGNKGEHSGGGGKGRAGHPGVAAQERGSALPLHHATGGGLPFTGFDLALVALLGIALLALGAAIRLAARTRVAARRA